MPRARRGGREGRLFVDISQLEMRREEWLEPHPISLVGGFYPSNLVPYVFPVRKDEYNSLTELICRGELTQAGVVSEPSIQMLPEEEGQV